MTGYRPCVSDSLELVDDRSQFARHRHLVASMDAVRRPTLLLEALVDLPQDVQVLDQLPGLLSVEVERHLLSGGKQAKVEVDVIPVASQRCPSLMHERYGEPTLAVLDAGVPPKDAPCVPTVVGLAERQFDVSTNRDSPRHVVNEVLEVRGQPRIQRSHPS